MADAAKAAKAKGGGAADTKALTRLAKLTKRVNLGCPAEGIAGPECGRLWEDVERMTGDARNREEAHRRALNFARLSRSNIIQPAEQ